MQGQVNIVLQQLLGDSVWHQGLEGLSYASPEKDLEAGLLRGQPASHSHEVLGVILNAPISLADVDKLPCWTHVY